MKAGYPQFRAHRIEQDPNLIITRNFVQAEESVGVTLPLAGGHVALIGQKRGALREKHGKGAQGGIDQGVVFILAFALVRKGGNRGPQGLDKVSEGGELAHAPFCLSSGVVLPPYSLLPEKASSKMRIAAAAVGRRADPVPGQRAGRGE